MRETVSWYMSDEREHNHEQISGIGKIARVKSQDVINEDNDSAQDRKHIEQWAPTSPI